MSIDAGAHFMDVVELSWMSESLYGCWVGIHGCWQRFLWLLAAVFMDVRDTLAMDVEAHSMVVGVHSMDVGVYHPENYRDP